AVNSLVCALFTKSLVKALCTKTATHPLFKFPRIGAGEFDSAFRIGWNSAHMDRSQDVSFKTLRESILDNAYRKFADIDSYPLPTQLFRRMHCGSAAAEWVKNNVVLFGRRSYDAF